MNAVNDDPRILFDHAQEFDPKKFEYNIKDKSVFYAQPGSYFMNAVLSALFPKRTKKDKCQPQSADISNEETYLALKDIGNITFVRGNNDKDHWAKGLNKSEVVEIDGFKIYVVHDIKDLPKNLEDVDLVVFGHSHKYFYEEVNGVIFLNPGSCGKKRFSLPLSFAIGILEQNRIKIIKHDL